MNPLNSRLAALQILKRFRKQKSWTTDVLTSVQSSFNLNGRDTAFASKLAKTVLENQNMLDFYIDHFSNASFNSIENDVLDILRIAIAQCLYMDRVPFSAAVDTAVSCCRTTGHERACKYVNGLLRHFLREKDNLKLPCPENEADRLSLWYTHPKWMVERLISFYDIAHTEAFLRANNTTDDINFYINPIKTSSEEFLNLMDSLGVEYRINPDWDDAIQIHHVGRITEIPGYDEGYFYIQDPAAHEVSIVSGVRPGMMVLDCCAAPGGKSISTAILMNNRGHILDLDIHNNKLKRIQDNCARLGINIIDAKCQDAREPLEGKFDIVLADVPCSGTGVIGKRPEIRYKSEESIRALPEIQFSILQNICENVSADGCLIYSTCSVLPEENEQVINRFLSSNEEFSLEGFETAGKLCNGMFTYWPQKHHTDGFFICKLRKKTE